MKALTQNLQNLLELLYPQLCVACGNRLVSQERYVCMHCWFDLPATNFHRNPENKVAQLFWGRVQIENATAFFSYRKGSNYQNLIHFVKYKGMKELGFETGKRFGFALSESAAFQLVDYIVPVPLHPSKEKKRGYNQSEWIARGIAETLSKPLSVNNLVRLTQTSTQTKKNRFERWQNVENIFEVKNPDEFSEKHILIIDDVVTTGSTLEACASVLIKTCQSKVSVATLAFADV